MYDQYLNQGPASNSVGIVGVYAIATVLDAAICGAVDVCILRFANIVQIGAGVAPLSTANNGTTFTITRPGIYLCTLTYAASAGGTINHVGITMDTNAAGLVNDPGMATVGILDYASCLSPALQNSATKLEAVAIVTKAQAVATAIIRFHAGDGANATPAGGDVTEAECSCGVWLLGNLT